MLCRRHKSSLPLRKCGLKPTTTTMIRTSYMVTSLAEVWIETTSTTLILSAHVSLPLRKCGLKPLWLQDGKTLPSSLPLRKCGLKLLHVHPHGSAMTSLPLRKCGLKPESGVTIVLPFTVTSLAEVWIETSGTVWYPSCSRCHFPCGSVD